AVADGADDGELPGRSVEQHLDRRPDRDVVVRRRGRVDGDLAGTGGRRALEDVHLAPQALVGRHAVAHGGCAAGRLDRLAVVVGQQGVAVRHAFGRLDAVGRAYALEDLRGDRCPAGAGAFGLGVRRLLTDDRVST